MVSDSKTPATTLGSGILAKVRNIAGTIDVPNTVHRALTDKSLDTAESSKLLSSFRESVDRNEVIGAILKSYGLNPVQCKDLNETMLSFLLDYYHSIGTQTACDLIERLCMVIKKEESSIRNITYLLNHAISHLNLLDSEKLRECVLKELPSLISDLYLKHKGASYFLAQTYFCLIVSVEQYFNRSAIDEWSKLYTEDLKKDPYFTALNVILRKKLKKLILPTSAGLLNDWEMNPEALLAKLVLTQVSLATFITNFEEALHFALDLYLENDKVNELKEQLLYVDSFLFTESARFWDLVVEKLTDLLGIRFLDQFSTNYQDHLKSLIDSSQEVPMKKRKTESKKSQVNAEILNLFLDLPLNSTSPECLRKALNFLRLCTFSNKLALSSSSWLVLYKCLVDKELTSVSLDQKLLALFMMQDQFTLPETLYLHEIAQTLAILTSSKKAIKSFLKSLDQVKDPNLKLLSGSMVLHLISMDLIEPTDIEASVIINLIDAASGDENSTLSACIFHPLSRWKKEHVNAAINANFFTSKYRKKIIKLAHRDIKSGSTELKLKIIALRFFTLRAPSLLDDMENSEKAHIECFLDWSLLAQLDTEPRVMIAAKAHQDKLASFILELPEELNEELILALKDLLSPKLQNCYESLVSILENALIKAPESKTQIQLACSILSILPTQKNANTSIVPLIMASAARDIISIQNVQADDIQHLLLHGKLLLSLIRSATQTILHDQCALFIELLGCYLRVIGKFVKQFPNEKVIPSLRDVCDRIVATMALHESFFEKTIPAVIALTVFYWEAVPLAFIRLCSIMKPKLSACLATNLPPAEKRAFSRLLELVKKANKNIA